jgi:hypothetical protein
MIPDKEVLVGEIREWLRPLGPRGEFHRFLVLEKGQGEWGQSVKIMYPNGFIDDVWESDLLRDVDDPTDNEYSVRLEDAEAYHKSIVCKE